jgi:23S rRNA pseudouridine1911/1915/1917 synthase
VFLAAHLPDLSRAALQKLIRAEHVLVDDQPVKTRHLLAAGETIRVAVPHLPPVEIRPEALPVDIVYQDDDLLVVNKPKGLTVHPGAGRPEGTLVNALLAHYPALAGVGDLHRPGLVHRLDRETSGLLVVAKNTVTLDLLARQVRAREVIRKYQAVVWGRMPDPPPGQQYLRIDAPIGRHPSQRTKMAVVSADRPDARAAVTRVRILERFQHFTLIEAVLETGRTHQIRVHLSYLGHPVAGDPVYGLRIARPLLPALPPELRERVEELQGQALHAYALSFHHPRTGAQLDFSVEMPEDMRCLLSYLREAEPIADAP